MAKGDKQIGGRSRKTGAPTTRRGRVPSYSESQLALQELGRAIKKLREDQGLTIAELAKKTSIAPQTIIKFEDGGRPIRITLMQELADCLGHRLELGLVRKKPDQSSPNS